MFNAFVEALGLSLEEVEFFSNTNNAEEQRAAVANWVIDKLWQDYLNN